MYRVEVILVDRDRGTYVPLLLHVEYWLTELLTLLYDKGLGDREISKLLFEPCRFASSAMEPVSTETDILLLYDGLKERVFKYLPFSDVVCDIV